MTSLHYIEERKLREQNIRSIGEGKEIASFKVDRGHRNGPEIHKITDTAIIKIYNEKSGKLITKLIARPGQIRRYYKEGKAPNFLIEKAKENTELGLNF